LKYAPAFNSKNENFTVHGVPLSGLAFPAAQKPEGGHGAIFLDRFHLMDGKMIGSPKILGT
jgi:hypothetical protein